MGEVSATRYGPVTVVRNGEARYASVDGPGGNPVLIRASAGSSDGEIIRQAEIVAERVWSEAGGMPWILRVGWEKLRTFDPLELARFSSGRERDGQATAILEAVTERSD